MDKKLIFFVLMIFLVSTASAFEFDNRKQTEDIGKDYPRVTIKNAFGLGDTLWQGELKNNTNICWIDCSAEKEIVLYERGRLIDEVKFETILADGSRIEQPIREYQLYYLKNKVKIPYNFQELNAGTYTVILEGKKKPSRAVDWIIKSQGVWIDDWAVWGVGAEVVVDDSTQYSTTSGTFDLKATYTFDNNVRITNFSSELQSQNLGSQVIRNVTLEYNNGSFFESVISTQTNAGEWTRKTFNNPNADETVKEIKLYLRAGSGGQTVSSRNQLASGFNGSYITLDSPINNLFLANPTVTFNATIVVLGGGNIINASLWHNGTGTWHMNQSEDLGGTTNFTTLIATFGNQTIGWNIESCDSDGDCGFSPENRTVTVKTFPPTINLSAPNNETYILDFFSISYPTVDLNWTVNDTILDACWYEYNVTNTTVTCGDNQTTFVTDDQTNITFWANDTIGNLNSQMAYWFYSFFVLNETTFTGSCGDDSINWTTLPDGTYQYNVTSCDVGDVCNTTETRTANVDTTFPVVNYASNSDPTNITANFAVQDSIFVNVTVTELHEANITFYLWNSTSSVNVTTYDDSTRIINWINLPEDMYFYNATVCDYAFNCNGSINRNYGVEVTNLSFYSNFSNIEAELGGTVLVNASNNLGIVCFDVDHPSYGINASCGTFQTGLELFIDYFRKNIFNDSTISKMLNYSGDESKTVFFPAHQWDEVDNMSINISGSLGEGFPDTVVINKSNSSEVDRIFPGFLRGSNIYLNKTIFAEGDKSLFFQNPSSQLLNFYMDDSAKFISFIFNITGLELGVNYQDDFNDSSILDQIENQGMFKGAFALPKGESLKSFVYDPFDASASLKSDLWESRANGIYYVCDTTISSSSCAVDDEYTWTLDNHYNADEMILDSFFQEATAGANSVSSTANNYAYTNFSKFNIWTNQQIDIQLGYDITGSEDESEQSCIAYNQIYLGEVLFWQSPWQKCEDSPPSSCNEGARDLGNLTFHFTRNINNSWNMIIEGTEEAYGDDLLGGNCGSYNFVYNYTNNTLSKTYQFPGAPGCSPVNSVVFLENDFTFSNLNFNTVEQFKFNQYNKGFYDNVDGKGCSNIDSTMNIKVVNRSLYSLSNSSIISDSVYDSAGLIPKATLNTSSWFIAGTPLSTVTLYLSSDDGLNWENVASGIQHTFTDQGNNLKYRLEFNLSQEGYLNSTIFVKNLSIITPKGFPTNVSFDFGNDGVEDYEMIGELNASNSPLEITITTANLVSALNAAPILYDHLISVPLKVTSDSVGRINLEFFNLTYDPNPVKLNKTFIEDFLTNSSGFADIPIFIESTGGNITVNDIRYDYAGGNSTINVLAHNEDYSQNISRNITYYYSRWDYEWGPANVEWIFFAPKNSTDANVVPYGQTSTIPIMNITNHGYGGRNASLSIYQNGTSSCVNSTLSLTNDKLAGSLINESWFNLTNLGYLDTVEIFLWADYNCSYNTWNMFEPQYYFRQCALGVEACSEDII